MNPTLKTVSLTRFPRLALQIFPPLRPAFNRKAVAAMAMAFMLGIHPTHAVPVSVPNASFESPGSPQSTSTNVNLVPGWVFNVKNGSQFGVGSIASKFSLPGTSSGSEYATINNDYPDVTDTITSAASLGIITPLTTYTLTLAIGNENQSDSSLYGAPGPVSFSLLANGVVFATKTVPNGSVANGTFKDFTLTYTTTTSASIIGDTLKIQLATLPEEGTAYQPAFDNVRLDALVEAPPVVPEPSTWALLASGLITLGWLMRRQRAWQTA
jgi:hypothetical protein